MARPEGKKKRRKEGKAVNKNRNKQANNQTLHVGQAEYITLYEISFNKKFGIYMKESAWGQDIESRQINRIIFNSDKSQEDWETEFVHLDTVDKSMVLSVSNSWPLTIPLFLIFSTQQSVLKQNLE